MGVHRAIRGQGQVDDTAYVDPSAYVSSSALVSIKAFVDRGAFIGVNAYVGLRTIVGAGAHIGDGAFVGADCIICDKARIADGAVIVDGSTVLSDCCCDGGGSGGLDVPVLTFDSINLVGDKLVDYITTGKKKGTLAYVGNDTFANQGSVHAYFVLVYGEALTPDDITVVNSPTFATDGAQWLRQQGSGQANEQWQARTTWYIDPAGTNVPPGNDEYSGASSAFPIKSIAEWRRRNAGAVFTAPVVINVLSTSTLADDGLFTGFSTLGANANVILQGTPTVLFSGTITANQDYAGNNRGTVTDSAIPVSWTASGGISSAAGSRLIRKVGGGKEAWLLQDLGSKTAAIGLPTNTSETGTTGFPSTTITPFVVGDAYEVVSRTKWPALVAPGAKVRYQCLDVTNSPSIGFTLNNVRDQYVLCGFIPSMTFADAPVTAINCLFLNLVNAYLQFSPFACTFMNALQLNQQTNLNGTTNVLYGAASQLRVFHGSTLSTSGTVYVFDNTTSAIYFHRDSHGYIDSLQGSGNSGFLIQCDQLGVCGGGGNITAVTSSVTPLSVDGISYVLADIPIVDDGKGSAIYT